MLIFVVMTTLQIKVAADMSLILPHMQTSSACDASYESTLVLSATTQASKYK